LDIVEYILKESNLDEFKTISNNNNREERLIPLMKALCRLTYIRTKRSLLVRDHITFGMRIAQIFIQCYPNDNYKINDEILSFLIRGKGNKEGKPVNDNIMKNLELSSIGASLLGNLYTLNGFDNLEKEVNSDLNSWLLYRTGDAEYQIPNNFETGNNNNNEHNKILEKIAIQKVFRCDQMIRTCKLFIEKVFAWNLYEFDANADSLKTIVLTQINEDTPILMASTPGNDPSIKIDQLANEVFEQQVNKKYQAFAMGSPEDYKKAEDAVISATKKGTWVCLKNVHLSPSWLQSLEKNYIV